MLRSRVRDVSVFVFSTGLTFSYFQWTLPRGWRLAVLWLNWGDLSQWPTQTAVRQHDGADRPLFPQATLSIWLSTRPFFCTHGTIWYLSLCIQSDKYHKVGEEWEREAKTVLTCPSGLCSRIGQMDKSNDKNTTKLRFVLCVWSNIWLDGHAAVKLHLIWNPLRPI